MSWLGLGRYDEPNREDPTYAAPKRGAARLLQLLLCNLWDYCKANMLCCLCFLPAAAAGGAALLLTRNYLLCSALALLCSIPAGGGLCGLHRVCNRSLRDLEGRVYPAFRKGFCDGFRRAILPGMLTTAEVLLSFYLVLFHSVINAFAMPVRLWILLFLVLAFLHLLLQYCFPLLAVVDLPLRDLFRNNLVLFFATPKRALPCFFCTALWWAAGVLLFPLSLPAVAFFGIAFCALLRQLFTWPAIDRHFSIAERQQQEQKAFE